MIAYYETIDEMKCFFLQRWKLTIIELSGIIFFLWKNILFLSIDIHDLKKLLMHDVGNEED